MAGVKKIIETLHPLERKVLPALSKHASLNELIKETGLKEVEVMRALQWLENKGILKIKKELKEVAVLDKNGKEYAKKGLPEKRVLKALEKGDIHLKDVVGKAGIAKEELNICLGALKQKAAIMIDKWLLRITDQGKKILAKESFEEKLLKKLSEKEAETKSLSPEEKFAYENLKKRKQIIKTSVVTLREAGLTELGKKAVKEKISSNAADRLTPEMLKKGEWKGKSFRRYDVKINVPEIYGGRKQHYRNFLEEVRRKFLEMGFKECEGPIVECDFFNMDALYMPQFHSARDIHDAYYIKEPKYCKLDESIVKKVKAAHENGFGTGSRGWRYDFDINKTKMNLLRTHDTSISSRTLSSKKLKIPGKYFQISRCFRPDVIDASHNVDFNQIGGFVIGENLNLRHLFGLLAMFAKEFAGTTEYKIVPGYFPFTEPSAELLAKHPDLGWIELAGSGMFRPEMVKPLVGKVVPVVAWGVGIDRLAMLKLGIKDIRKLFSHDLNFLRSAKVI